MKIFLVICVYIADMASTSVLRLTLYPNRLPALQYVPSPTVKRSRGRKYGSVPLPFHPNPPLNYEQSPAKTNSKSILNIPAVFNKFAENVFGRQKKSIMNVMKECWPSKNPVHYFNTDLPRPKQPGSTFLEPVFRPSSVDLNRSRELQKQTDLSLAEAVATKKKGDWGDPEARPARSVAGSEGALEIEADKDKGQEEESSSKEIKVTKAAKNIEVKGATRGFLVIPQERTLITRGVLVSEALINGTSKVHRSFKSNTKFIPKIPSKDHKTTIGPSKAQAEMKNIAFFLEAKQKHTKLFPPFPFSFGGEKSKNVNGSEETKINIDIMKEAVKSIQPHSKRMVEGQKAILQKISRIKAAGSPWQIRESYSDPGGRNYKYIFVLNPGQNLGTRRIDSDESLPPGALYSFLTGLKKVACANGEQVENCHPLSLSDRDQDIDLLPVKKHSLTEFMDAERLKDTVTHHEAIPSEVMDGDTKRQKDTVEYHKAIPTEVSYGDTERHKETMKYQEAIPTQLMDGDTEGHKDTAEYHEAIPTEVMDGDTEGRKDNIEYHEAIPSNLSENKELHINQLLTEQLFNGYREVRGKKNYQDDEQFYHNRVFTASKKKQKNQDQDQEQEQEQKQDMG